MGTWSRKIWIFSQILATLLKSKACDDEESNGLGNTNQVKRKMRDANNLSQPRYPQED